LECLAISGGGKIQYNLEVVPEEGHIGGGDVVAEEVEYMYTSRLRANPFVARMENRANTCSQCCSLDLLSSPLGYCL
jgi:hypothetical protein